MLPIYDVIVINLPNRQDRRASIEKWFGAIPYLRVHIMEAVDRRNLPTVHAYGKDVTGWKACYLSHEKAFELANQYELPIVFEDDCVFANENATPLFKQLLDWCHDHRFEDWDVLKPDLNFFEEKVNPGMMTEEIQSSVPGRIVRVHNSLSTTAVIYSKQFANALKSKTWTFCFRAIDDLLNGNCRVLTHFPRLLCQPQTFSDVVLKTRQCEWMFEAAQKALANRQIHSAPPDCPDLVQAVMTLLQQTGWDPSQTHWSIRVTSPRPKDALPLKLFHVLSAHPQLRVILCTPKFACDFTPEFKYATILLDDNQITLNGLPIEAGELRRALSLALEEQ